MKYAINTNTCCGPLWAKVNEFAAAGYSISGGVVQLAAVLDSTLDAVIALNPTIIIEDCDGCANYDYCICLLPEHLDHNVPVLLFLEKTR